MVFFSVVIYRVIFDVQNNVTNKSIVTVGHMLPETSNDLMQVSQVMDIT